MEWLPVGIAVAALLFGGGALLRSFGGRKEKPQ